MTNREPTDSIAITRKLLYTILALLLTIVSAMVGAVIKDTRDRLLKVEQRVSGHENSTSVLEVRMSMVERSLDRIETKLDDVLKRQREAL